jgi:UDP-N-acetylmuramyl tripeptide synthase
VTSANGSAPAGPVVRTRLAANAANAVNHLSRLTGRGGGTVAGGRVALGLDPQLVTRLASGRQVALVSGTNGKTTTTALLAAAMRAKRGTVVSNLTGANMPAGHAAALAAAITGPQDAPVVLEVDEGYLPRALTETKAAAVVLLNLSRDQLDRTSEVRMAAAKWRSALSGSPAAVVANCDDPLVTWAASSSDHVVWVAAGNRWHADAVGCPACSGRLSYEGGGWSCHCGFGRPRPTVEVVEAGGSSTARLADGTTWPLRLQIPGRFNLANAVLAALAAQALGVPAHDALAAMATVTQVAGRFAVMKVGGVPTRLLLAKNPAGWAELLELMAEERRPLVVGINARVADGRDPSRLWDVAFEQLGHRHLVVATGERCRDLAVRLRYAGVEHRREEDPVAAVALARSAGVAAGVGDRRPDGAQVDLVGNYTVFHDLWRRR